MVRSWAVLRSLEQMGLIDEYRLVVHPKAGQVALHYRRKEA